jgi:hypothetical protein
MNMFRRKEPAAAVDDVPPSGELTEDSLASVSKNKWEKIWPVLACGSGLFAEGYVQSVYFLPGFTAIQKLTFC